MDRKNDKLKRITHKEKRVLNYLLNNGRIRDTKISEKLKISVQGARKIRKKLEKKLIKNYTAEIDYSLIGFKMFAIVIFHPLGKVEKVINLLQPHLASLYRIHKSFVTYVSLLAFRSIDDLEELFHKMRTEYSDLLEIKQTKIFSAKGLIKHSDFSLLRKHVSYFGKENVVFPNKINYFKYKKNRSAVNKKIKINENEKKFLNKIRINSKISMTELAKHLEVSSTAADKIRNRLERKGIIKKYSAKLNYAKLGIKLFAFIALREKNDLNSYIHSWASGESNLISCYKLLDGSTWLLYGFKDLEELEQYLYSFQIKNRELIEIEDVNVFTNNGIIHDSFNFNI